MNLILIQHSSSSTIIALPVEKAAIAAELLAHATVYRQDDYPRHANYVPADDGLTLSYDNGERFTPASKKLLDAQKAAEDNSARWYKEYSEHEKAKKELAEVRAALAAIQAVTVCQTVEVEPVTELERDEEEE